MTKTFQSYRRRYLPTAVLRMIIKSFKLKLFVVYSKLKLKGLSGLSYLHWRWILEFILALSF